MHVRWSEARGKIQLGTTIVRLIWRKLFIKEVHILRTSSVTISIRSGTSVSNVSGHMSPHIRTALSHYVHNVGVALTAMSVGGRVGFQCLIVTPT